MAKNSTSRLLRQCERLISVVKESKTVSAVFVPNSWPVLGPLDVKGKPVLGVHGNLASKSGPATARAALNEAGRAVDALHGSEIDVVLSGGVMDNKNLHQRASLQMRYAFAIGAIAACGSTFFRENEDWVGATKKLVDEFSKVS